jgi:hypothetical protein
MANFTEISISERCVVQGLIYRISNQIVRRRVLRQLVFKRVSLRKTDAEQRAEWPLVVAHKLSLAESSANRTS